MIKHVALITIFFFICGCQARLSKREGMAIKEGIRELYTPLLLSAMDQKDSIDAFFSKLQNAVINRDLDTYVKNFLIKSPSCREYVDELKVELENKIVFSEKFLIEEVVFFLPDKFFAADDSMSHSALDKKSNKVLNQIVCYEDGGKNAEGNYKKKCEGVIYQKPGKRAYVLSDSLNNAYAYVVVIHERNIEGASGNRGSSLYLTTCMDGKKEITGRCLKF